MCGYNQVAIENVKNRMVCSLNQAKDSELQAYSEGKTLENIMMYHDEALLWHFLLEQFERMMED